MKCTTIIELLPWLLNGSLEEPERREVEEHLESCPGCRRELEQTRAAGGVYAAHAPPGALVDHAAGRTPEGIAGEVLARHLAHCPTCSEELALLRESHSRLLDEPAAPTAEAGAVEEDASATAEEGAGATVVAGPWTAKRWRRLAVAASLAGMAAVGASVWTLIDAGTGAGELAARLAGAEEQARALAAENRDLRASGAALRQEVEELTGAMEETERRAAEIEDALDLQEERLAAAEPRRPAIIMRPRVEVESLRPQETVLRDAPGSIFGGEGEELPSVSRGIGFALLSLRLPGELPPGAAEAAVRLEVVDAAGDQVLVETGPPPGGTYAYVVGLPTAGLEPGEYTLRLRSEGAGETALLGTYELTVE